MNVSQAERPRNEDNGPTIEDNEDDDMNVVVNVSSRRRPGRPRKEQSSCAVCALIARHPNPV
jgi:hypothetical protein